MKTTQRISTALLILLLFAGGASGQQNGPQASNNTLLLPMEFGTTVVASTQLPQDGYITLGQVELGGTLVNDSIKIKAPDTAQVVMIGVIGDKILPACNDSIPPGQPGGCFQLYGMILDGGDSRYILTGLDSASVAQTGLSTGSTVMPGQDLGEWDPDYPLHIEEYVPGRSGQVLDPNTNHVIRDWAYFYNGRMAYRYDTHNREMAFCLGSTVRPLQHGEVLTAGPCGTSGSKRAAITPVSGAIAASVYPNPAGNAATLRFSLEKPSAVKAVLTDLSGRTVLRRAIATLPPGDHNIDLDLAQLPNGMYLYRLTAEGQSAQGKLLVRH